MAQEWLVALNNSLSQYGRQLEQATAREDSQLVADARVTKDHVVEEIRTNANLAARTVQETPSGNIAGIVLGWIAVAWSIGLCIPVAGRSHRVLNLGMLGMVAACLAIAWWFTAPAADFANSAGNVAILENYLGQMAWLSTVSPLICLVGGIAGVWGIQQRIREYK
jgi:hypothetical protein